MYMLTAEAQIGLRGSLITDRSLFCLGTSVSDLIGGGRGGLGATPPNNLLGGQHTLWPPN